MAAHVTQLHIIVLHHNTIHHTTLVGNVEYESNLTI